MQKLISRRTFVSGVGAVGAVAGASGAVLGKDALALDRNTSDDPDTADAVDTPLPVPNPDPEHLLQQGRGWRVLPNGSDDQQDTARRAGQSQRAPRLLSNAADRQLADVRFRPGCPRGLRGRHHHRHVPGPIAGDTCR